MSTETGDGSHLYGQMAVKMMQKKSVLDIISICINSIQIKQIIFYNVDDFI